MQTIQHRPVEINSEGNILRADLDLPSNACAIVLFAHGSGSGRLSPRNRFVAEKLNQDGLATLLLDLLTVEEEHIELHTRHLRFDIGLLTDRLSEATNWLKVEPELRGYPVGYFGASTGAAAALAASVRHPSVVQAVVSRGGRPDLAGDTLSRVTAPTLLIVGSLDDVVIDLNKEAMRQMRCETHLEVVPGASHLFEELGKLEVVSRLASDWFTRFLCKGLP
jgi:putative phosphoribosyl transferase